MSDLRRWLTDRALARAHAIKDLRELARARLPRPLFDFIDGGAEDETTRHANADDFDYWRLMPRVAVDVSARDAATSLLGRPARLPLVLSPTGLAGFFWRDGELATVRAAARHGVPYCLSTNSIASIEQVAAAAPHADLWFQLYFLKDRNWMAGLVDRAEAAGYRVLVLTVDLPLSGRRERDHHNAFTMPLRPRARTVLDLARHPGWLLDMARAQMTFGNFEMPGQSGFTNIVQHVATLFDPSMTWADVARLRERWKGRFVIKGILHPDDAVKAVEIGADAVMVSNHGGRQLDASPSAIAALPAIAAAVGGKTEVILDGGITRATEMLKALALGATACGMGRAHLWGLAAGGEAGVSRMLDLLTAELSVSMALLGTARVTDITPDHIRPADPNGGRTP